MSRFPVQIDARESFPIAAALAAVVLCFCAAPLQAAESDGCGSEPTEAAPASIAVNGVSRDLIAVVPDAYQNDRPHNLILAFHGRTNSNAQVRSYYRLENEDATDTIFVYPSGTRTTSGDYSWWQRGDTGEALRDYALFDRLVETFGARYCIDLERIFVVGHSLGATFANSLACARGGQIRAVVALGGGIVPSECRGRVAAMVLHNPKDNLVSIEEGRRARDIYLTQAGYRPPAAEAQPQDFNCVRYGPDDGRYPILWCAHHKDYNGRGKYYPHTWPPDAGRAVMGFLNALPDP